ncbi:sigma-54-dependent transcriptional regulator [Geopsychrobacter electrodiphilus]|uniref:sigma-54-dependent transcriptional regulator n=1 Tax=Geopsychrobacter electrodiphilus TaxID=225196 RepID=UPI000364F7B9|nr:sigma-54 dependent transcriptional regulator [Geopsychrobacter electrodiphilus]
MSTVARPRILVVDDDKALLEALVQALRQMGYEVLGEHDPLKGLVGIGSWDPDVVIFDLKMPGMDGLELLRRALLIEPELPVLLLTAHATIETAVQAVRNGAYDFLEKPFDLTKIELTLQQALNYRGQKRRYQLLAETTARIGTFEGIVGESAAIREVIEAVTAVAETDSTVLVTGESGTGKELVARAVHVSGSRKEKPFITVDCAAIPDSLLESELFGHVKGAFTGAYRERAGYFEAAADGTVFLDEIGEIPHVLQKKLLRVLQEKTFSRVGESRQRTSEARIVAATNRNLEKWVAEGGFREDLFYRLKVIEIPVPPLRERSEDIPLLVQHYLGRLNRKLNRKIQTVSPEVMAIFQRYPWPGNIRELVHLLEQIMTFHNPERLDPLHLPAYLRSDSISALPPESYASLKEKLLAEVGIEYFRKLLGYYRGNVTRVAEHAGLNRRHLSRLLQHLGLDPALFRK